MYYFSIFFLLEKKKLNWNGKIIILIYEKELQCVKQRGNGDGERGKEGICFFKNVKLFKKKIK